MRRIASPSATPPLPAAPPATEAPLRALDLYIEREMRRLQIPGLALAVVEEGRIVHRRGFGKVRPGGGAPTAQTPFRIGSLTKSFTALAVMQLVEAGRLDLDAPVQRYLPWFRLADADASARITLRHLLNQTSGLPQSHGMRLLADFDQSPGASLRQAQELAALKPAHPPGAAFEYSDLNYNVLGLVVEAASGEAYADYLRRHIFEPLGMERTAVWTLGAEGGEDGPLGYRYWCGWPLPAPALPTPRGSLASGQIISCADEMALYLIGLLSGGRLGDVRILSEAGVAELQRAGPEYRAMGIEVGRYGMGWFSSTLGQSRALWHGGNVPDFAAFMALLPEQRRGVVLLLNADHHMMVPVFVELGMGAAALPAGEPLPPPRFGVLIPWMLRALPLIPLLQIGSILMRRRRARAWPVGLLADLPLAAAPALLARSGMAPYLRLFAPEVGPLAILCAALAVLRIALRLFGGGPKREGRS